MSKAISCLKCKHYQSSWDPNKPRSCKAYGFSSATIPSFVIKKETGKECQAFSEKAHFRNNNDSAVKLDLNRDDLW